MPAFRPLPTVGARSAQRTDGESGSLRHPEQLKGMRQQQFSCGREAHLAGAAIEKAGAHLLLQQGDTAAESGLADVKTSRGPREVQLGAEHDERFYRLQPDSCYPPGQLQQRIEDRSLWLGHIGMSRS